MGFVHSARLEVRHSPAEATRDVVRAVVQDRCKVGHCLLPQLSIDRQFPLPPEAISIDRTLAFMQAWPRTARVCRHFGSARSAPSHSAMSRWMSSRFSSSEGRRLRRLGETASGDGSILQSAENLTMIHGHRHSCSVIARFQVFIAV